MYYSNSCVVVLFKKEKRRFARILRSTPYSLIASWQTGFDLQTCCACFSNRAISGNEIQKTNTDRGKQANEVFSWMLLVSEWLYNVSCDCGWWFQRNACQLQTIIGFFSSNQSWCTMDGVEGYDKNGESNCGNLQEFESAPISIKIHSGENESRWDERVEKNLISNFDGFSTVSHFEISRLMDRNSRVK